MQHRPCNCGNTTRLPPNKQLLKFWTISTDALRDSDTSKSVDVDASEVFLKPNASIFCTKKGNNFNIILSPLKHGSNVTITDFTILAPMTMYTGPIKNGLVWILDKEPNLTSFKHYNDYTQELFDQIDKSKVSDAPDLYFELDDHLFHYNHTFDRPLVGKYIFVKLISRKDDFEGKNIDVQEIIFWGYPNDSIEHPKTDELTFQNDWIYQNLEVPEAGKIEEFYQSLLRKHPEDDVLRAIYFGFLYTEKTKLAEIREMNFVRDTTCPLASAIVSYFSKNYNRAFAILSNLPAHHLVYFYLGLNYHEGNYVKQISGIAMDLWEKGAKMGNMRCNLGLAVESENYDIAKAMELYDLCASNGHTRAQCRLADIYSSKGGKLNERLAFKYYESASLKNMLAKRQLGLCFYNGHGIKEDHVKSLKIFQECAKKGDLTSAFFAASQLQSGDGCSKDLEGAYELYSDVIRGNGPNSPSAKYHLGLIFADTTFLMYDNKIAYDWFEEAEKAKNYDSLYYLGLYTYQGSGCVRNLEKALDYFKRGSIDLQVKTEVRNECQYFYQEILNLMSTTGSEFELERWKKQFDVGKIQIVPKITKIITSISSQSSDSTDRSPSSRSSSTHVTIEFAFEPTIPNSVDYSINLLRDGSVVAHKSKVKSCTTIEDDLIDFGKYTYNIVFNSRNKTFVSQDLDFNFERTFKYTQKRLDRYQIIQKLVQKISFGIVYLAKDLKYDRKVVVKMIPCDDSNGLDNYEKHFSESVTQNLFESCATLKLEHPNIVKSHDVFFEMNDDHTYVSIVMDWYENGDLTKYLKGKGSKLVYGRKMIMMLADIALGLEYLHKEGIIHRDIKTDNCFVNARDVVAIGDFGLIHQVDDTPVTRSVGTPGWMSPEIEQEREYSYSTDVFSFGVVILFMASRKSLRNVKQNDYHSFIAEEMKMYPDLCSLAQECCDLDPSKRPTSSNCYRQLIDMSITLK